MVGMGRELLDRERCAANDRDIDARLGR